MAYTKEERKQRNREAAAKWARANRDKINAAERERRANRTEEQKLAEREYRKRYYEANPEQKKATNRRSYEKSPETWILCNIKTRCKKEGIPFDLTKEDIVPPEFCPVLGIRLQRNHKGGSGNGPLPNSPAVDRIFPELGYVKDNIIVISHLANCIKQNATPFEIRRVADFYEKLMAEISSRKLKELADVCE